MTIAYNAGNGNVEINTGYIIAQTATSGTSTTITNSGASFAVNDFIGRVLWIKSGTGAGASSYIVSNTATVITVKDGFFRAVSGVWGTVTPDATSVFTVSYLPQDVASAVPTYATLAEATNAYQTLSLTVTFSLLSGGCYSHFRGGLMLASEKAIITVAGSLLQFGIISSDYTGEQGGWVQMRKNVISYNDMTWAGLGNLYGCKVEGRKTFDDTQNSQIRINGSATLAPTGFDGLRVLDTQFEGTCYAQNVNDVVARVRHTAGGGNSIYSIPVNVSDITYVDVPVRVVGYIPGGICFLNGGDIKGITLRGTFVATAVDLKPIDFFSLTAPYGVAYLVNTDTGPNGAFSSNLQWNRTSSAYTTFDASIYEAVQIDFAFTNTAGSAISSVVAGLTDASSNAGWTTGKNGSGSNYSPITAYPLTATAGGLISGAYVVRSKNNWGGGTDLSTTTVTYAPYVLSLRKYGYVYQTLNKNWTPKVTNAQEAVTLATNAYVVASEATAGAYTGISINGATKVITVSGTRTIQELYDYTQWWAAQTTNIQYQEPITTADGVTFTFTTGWSMSVTGNLTQTTKIISGTLTVSSSGVFEDSTGAKWDVSGTTYYGSRFAITIVDNSTSTAIQNAVVAFVETTGGTDKTYSLTRTAGGQTTDAAGLASGYAVWKIGATTYSTQKLLVGEYSYQWLTIPKTIAGSAITETDRLSADSFISISKASASAVSGVVTDHTAKTVNMATNTLSNTMHNLKVRQASVSNIETGVAGYLSFYKVQVYSDTGLILRYDGSYYFGAYGWVFSNSGGVGTLKQRDAGGAATTITSISLTGVVVGSQVQIYDVTTTTELSNATAATSTPSIAFTHTGTDHAIRVRVRKKDYNTLETTGTVTSNGLAVTINQVVDAIYNAIGIDGSTITECSLSGGTLLIYISAAGGLTSGQRIYAWYKYILATSTYIGLQPDDITAQTSTKFILNGGLKIKNQNVGIPLNITGANINPPSGNSTDVFDLSNSASMAINAYTVEGFPYSSGSGLSTPEHNALLALPSATVIADTTLRRSSANVEASVTGDALNIRSLYGMVAQGTNKTSVSGSTLTVTKSDDTTVLGTRAITTDATALPITVLDTN